MTPNITAGMALRDALFRLLRGGAAGAATLRSPRAGLFAACFAAGLCLPQQGAVCHK